MPPQNRVSPRGELVATPERGMFWGNRGCLVDDHAALVRYSRGKNWLVCELEFKGIKRVQWSPRRLTELYFLDEATALAAGHRPFAECRRPAYLEFKAAWQSAHRTADGATAIDAVLHADRLLSAGVQRTYSVALADLPDGTMIDLDGSCWLVLGDELREWTFAGYRARRPRPPAGTGTVVTPASTVRTLAAGYRPVPQSPAVSQIEITTSTSPGLRIPAADVGRSDKRSAPERW